jgi:glycosyltransferase 2 family protein
MEFLRRRLGLILQVIVSVLVIAWLSRIVNWGEVWLKMRSMDPGWIFLGLLCFMPVLLIVSYRWQMLLAVHGIHLRFWRVLELTMIGQFFGTIGLGTTGGDVAKVFYAARAVPKQRAAAAFTIIVDRVIGLMALLLFGSVLVLSRWSLLYAHVPPVKPGHLDPRWATRVFFLIAAVGIGGGIAATLGPYIMAVRFLRESSKKIPLLHRGTSVFRAYEATARAFGTNLLALIISIPSHVCVTLMGYCVIRAMSIPVDPVPLFAIIAMVNMLVALPISVGGIGVRESLFIAYLNLLGVDPDHATAFSITCFVMSLFWCLAGGPFYFLYRHETHTPPPDVTEVEPIFSER